jgi:hypothetical protein
MTRHDENGALMAQLRLIIRALHETRADWLLLGPMHDHEEAEHHCCPVIYGLSGDEVIHEALEGEDADALRLKRWALIGMVAEVTGGAVEVQCHDTTGALALRALALWPALAEQAKVALAWHSRVVGHA